jgi:hypothetical protein
MISRTRLAATESVSASRLRDASCRAVESTALGCVLCESSSMHALKYLSWANEHPLAVASADVGRPGV